MDNSLQFAQEALNEYGGSLSETGKIVTPLGKETQVSLLKKGKRLRIESPTGLLTSGALTKQTVYSFVEGYWFWEKGRGIV